MAACAQAGADLALVQGMKAAVDCNIGNLVQAGYAAVSGPNSQLPTILTAMLTLYIAIFGLRLMMGLAPLRIGDVTLTVVKLVAVLALATSWPLYQQLIFETLYRGPEQIAGALIGGGSGSEKALNGALDSLQRTYDELQAAANFYAQRSNGQLSPFVGGAGFGAFALNAGSILMLMISVGMLLAAKIVLALLLVMGPLFVGFLLFDATRGLFEGWLRAAVTFALAPILGVVTLVISLNLVEPHLARLAAIRAQGETDIAPAIAVFCLLLVVTAVAVGGAVAMGILATGFRLNWKKPAAAQATPAEAQPATTQPQDRPQLTFNTPGQELAPRTSQVAAAAAALERRDTRLFVSSVAATASAATRDQGRFELQPQAALGQTFRRSNQTRSASSARRDG